MREFVCWLVGHKRWATTAGGSMRQTPVLVRGKFWGYVCHRCNKAQEVKP